MIDYTDIFAAIRRRHSARTFNGLRLDGELNLAVQTAISQAEPLWQRARRPQIFLVNADENGRLGTYGVIQGAREYLTMYCGETVEERMNAGYELEQVVLRCADMGLGTCWLGGTFRKDAFPLPAYLREGEGLTIVSPVGHPAENRRLLERVSRRLANSDRRLPFDQLFRIDPSAPHAEGYRRCLEAVRLAPSSTNSQPWRAAVTGQGVVEFTTAAHTRFTPYDMGIALCHFALAARAEGLAGKFEANPSEPLPSVNFLP